MSAFSESELDYLLGERRLAQYRSRLTPVGREALPY
jgi:hypothetical protein